MSLRLTSRARDWSSDGSGPDRPLRHGPVRISGAVLDRDARWFAVDDHLGWTTLALYSGGRAAEHGASVLDAMRQTAGRGGSPCATALAVREAVGVDAHQAGLGIARVGKHGPLVELLNVSLPTLVEWSPRGGLSPFEALGPSLADLSPTDRGEVILLRPGAAIVMASEGLLGAEASWAELQGFVRSLGLDPLGASLSDVPSAELRRLLTGLPRSPGPRGIVVAGVPTPAVLVA